MFGMDMPDMEMPGGWSMSMAWMRMPGQSWPGAALMFMAMWIAMMVVMMLPVLAPVLWRRHRSIGGAARVAGAYFAAWTLLGVVAYPLGVALAQAEMRLPPLARAVPALAGALLMLAAMLQLSAWKRRQLACCRHVPARHRSWRCGWQLGLRCLLCCAPLTAMLFIVGVMQPLAMIAATLAIAAERLAPAGARIARFVGGVMLLAGAGMLAQAALA